MIGSATINHMAAIVHIVSYEETSIVMRVMCILKWGLHGGVMVSTVTSQREGSRFQAFLCFECSPRVCAGSLQVLRLPPTVQKQVLNWWLLNCPLEWVWVCVWLFVSVWPCDGLATCPGCTSASRQMITVIGSSPPPDPTNGLSGYGKWIDGS